MLLAILISSSCFVALIFIKESSSCEKCSLQFLLYWRQNKTCFRKIRFEESKAMWCSFNFHNTKKSKRNLRKKSKSIWSTQSGLFQIHLTNKNTTVYESKTRENIGEKPNLGVAQNVTWVKCCHTAFEFWANWNHRIRMSVNGFFLLRWTCP